MSKAHLFRNPASETLARTMQQYAAAPASAPKLTATSPPPAALAAPAKASAPKAAAKFQADPTVAASQPGTWLTLAQAAESLGLAGDNATLTVARLAASNRVAAGRVPSGGDRPTIGEWRISQNGLNAFVGRGCPGFPGPEISIGDGWFRDRDDSSRDSETFLGTVRAALEQAAPNDEELRRRIGDADALEVEITPTALSSVFAAPVARQWTRPGDPAPEFTWSAHAWMALELRRILRHRIERETGVGSAIGRLFSTSQEFTRLTGLGHADLAKSVILSSKNVRIVSDTTWPRDVPCRLLVKIATFVPDAAKCGFWFL